MGRGESVGTSHSVASSRPSHPSVALVTLIRPRSASCRATRHRRLAKADRPRSMPRRAHGFGHRCHRHPVQGAQLQGHAVAAACQCDKHAYAEAVQTLIASRPEIEVIAGSVERLVVEGGRVKGVVVRGQSSKAAQPQSNKSERSEARRDGRLLLCPFDDVLLSAPAVVLTTGTFMRGLMHTGEQKSEGGRYGEAAAVGISGRDGLRTKPTEDWHPPRLKRSTTTGTRSTPRRVTMCGALQRVERAQSGC